MQAAGIPLTYEALDVAPEVLASTVEQLRAESAGGNVTLPHKRAFAELCDEVTMLGEQVGVVNAWWTDDGRIIGDNTDVFGAHAAAQEVLGHTPYDERVALIGSGGAAAAVLAAIAAWPRSSARVYGRNPARLETLCAQFPDVAQATSVLGDALRGATLVINATPIGLPDQPAASPSPVLAGSQLPTPIELIPPQAAVLDLVYGQAETPWVIAARDRGHRAADGLTMLLEQAALSFERWFGQNADRDAMRGAVARPA